MSHPQQHVQAQLPENAPLDTAREIRRARITLGVVLGVIVLAIAVVLPLALFLGDDDGDGARSGPSLQGAFDACGAGVLADGDATLILDQEGEELGSGDETIEGVACVLVELDTPASVLAQMDSTRALDGMQTADWDGFEASWTYHPDDGMDLVLTESGAVGW